MSAVVSKIGTPDASAPQRAPERDTLADFALARQRYADAQGAVQSARAALKRALDDLDGSFANHAAAVYTRGGDVTEVERLRTRAHGAREARPVLEAALKQAESALEDARAGLRSVVQKQVMQRREASLQRFALAAVELRNAYHDLLGADRACISLATLKAGSFDYINEPIRVAVPSDGKRAAAYESYGLQCYVISQPDEREVSRIMLALVDELKAHASAECWPFP